MSRHSRFLQPLALALLAMAFAAPSAHALKPPSFSGELGFRGAAGEQSRLSSFGRAYVEPAISWKREGDAPGLSMKLQGRAWEQIEKSFATRRARRALEVRDSYLAWESGDSRLRAGFQSLSWGETFGFFIADLPNPRDLSDPLLLEIGHIKKPVFMLQGHWFFEDGGVQAFFTPVARHTEFPVEIPNRGDFREMGRDSEYGLKVNRLFGFGLDASAFMLRHKDRAPTPDPQSLWSAGVTATQSLGTDCILRTDQVFSDLRKTMLDAWRGVVGLDWNATQNLMLSFQGQRDPLNSGGSLRMLLRGFEGDLDGLELEAFWFQGIEKRESWIQPKLTYSARSGWSVSARYDWIAGDNLASGLLSALTREDRALVWFTYGF